MKFGAIFFVSSVLAAAAPRPGDLLAATPVWFEPAVSGAYAARWNGGLVNIGPASISFLTGGKTERLEWVSADSARLGGAGFNGAYSDYRVGAKERWRIGVPHFETVEARGLYPGIDAVYYWRGGQFEFDLRVGPGAPPEAIRLRTPSEPVPQPDGSLLAGPIRLRQPVAFQDTATGRVEVAARYRVSGGTVGFTLGAYDRSLPLIIDPIVQVRYFGGDQFGRANAIATTPDGVVYIVGGASSETQIPASAPEQDLPKGLTDAFAARFVPEPNGEMVLTHFTFWGGDFQDEATAVVAGKDGFVYFAGDTESPDFPRGGATVQDPFGGGLDAFFVSWRPTDPGGETIWFSSYFGGTANENVRAITVDGDGMIYLGGTTLSGDVPGMQSGLQCCNRGGNEGWVAKFDPSSATPLVYSTIIGGDGTDIVTGIAVDAARNIYLTGYTGSSNFPVTIETRSRRRFDNDLFVVKLDITRPGLEALVEGFYLYGNSIDVSTGAALSGDRLWITGYTFSSDFPVTQSGYRNTRAAGTEAFAVGLDYTKPAPYPVVWGTYFGGTATDVAYGISVGSQGRVAIAGYTTSGNFPIKDSENQATLRPGVANAFLAVFDPAEVGDNSLKLSRVVGGSVQDVATGVAADQNGRYFASGTSRSYDLAVTDGAQSGVENGAEQSFIIRATAP